MGVLGSAVVMAIGAALGFLWRDLRFAMELRHRDVRVASNQVRVESGEEPAETEQGDEALPKSRLRQR